MRTADVELVLRTAEKRGIAVKPLALPNPTDAVVTAHAVLSTDSLLSCEGGWISRLHRSTDSVDNVNRPTGADAVTLVERLARNWTREDLPEVRR